MSLGEQLAENDAPRSRALSADRMRALRHRRLRGLRVVPLQVHETEIEALVRLGLLNPEMRGDRWEIAVALGRWLDRTLKLVNK